MTGLRFFAAWGNASRFSPLVRLFSAAAVVFVVVFLPVNARAVNWVGTSGSWFDPDNWDSGVPSAGTNAVINNGGTSRIAMPGAEARNTFVGHDDRGVLAIVDEGTLEDRIARIGNVANSTGTAMVVGSRALWSGDTIHVGQAGSGTLTVADGGQIAFDESILGNAATGIGRAMVGDGRGGGHWLTETLTVGLAGDGELNVNNGGAVEVDPGNSDAPTILGAESGSVGVLNVAGFGSRFTTTGDLIVGQQGDGRINIHDGGLVDVDGTTFIGRWRGGGGEIHFDGGQFRTRSLFLPDRGLTGFGLAQTHGLVADLDLVFDQDHAAQQLLQLPSDNGDDQQMYLLLDVDGTGIMGAGYRRYGTLSISDGQAVVSREGIIAYGAAAGGMASVTGRGSLWATTGEMYVGYQGNGAITISNQGAVSSRGTSIGFMPGATGVARVNGATWTNSSTMYVGRDGWGELTIENNSYVQTMSALLGVGIGSHGRATVASRDSRWEIQSSLNVGVGGGGELNVGFGGRVSSANVAIGVFSEATGSVTVNRGQLIAAEELVVGYGGEGALSVSEAGSVASGMALIGRDLGSFGTASLIGHGSEWNVDGQLNVGRQGTGHLSISNNALVTSSSGVVGQQVGSVGTVDVAGGTWAIDGSLWVGGAFGRGGARGGGSVGGSALVNIGPGGVVGVADDTVLFSNDVMRLDGGTLVTSEVDFRGGRLDWQSGTLHLTSEQGLAIGPGQPFDASVLLGPTQVLQVDHRLYVESRGRMVTESGINVGSAEIEPLGQLLVAGGQRAMFGDGVVNRGDLVFLAGTLVEGPVTNEERGVTTLLDDVVFLAPVDGEGNFHGHGLPSFAGGFLPGDGPANVFFASDIEFRPNNLLRIDVEGNFPIDEYDVLNVRGRANLGGTLEVLADPRVNVEIGDLLTFIHADGGVFGRFSSLELPSLTGGKMFRFMQDGTTVSLEVIATPPLPGDYNEDGIVNAADYIVWRNSQGTDAALPNRDAQLAGNVGMGDYEHWRAHFGHRVRGTSRATAVPEPTSWLLISLGILLVGGQRRRR